MTEREHKRYVRLVELPFRSAAEDREFDSLKYRLRDCFFDEGDTRLYRRDPASFRYTHAPDPGLDEPEWRAFP